MFPALEKMRSHGTEVAGTQARFRSSLYVSGSGYTFFLWSHHRSGSSSSSRRGSELMTGKGEAFNERQTGWSGVNQFSGKSVGGGGIDDRELS